ncbi:MAG TPA: PAS domain-containing protein [Parvibaculum sp.]|jgi:hypothetical protein
MDRDFDIIEFDKETLQFLDAPAHPGIAALAAYWEKKRGNRALPDRSDIDPADIVPLLPHITISEVLDGGADFRIRIFGTALVELIGEERTGKRLSEFGTDCNPPTKAERVRARWMDITTRALTSRRPAFVTGTMSSSLRPYIVWHAISCPLTAGGTEAAQMIGAMMVVR